VLEQAVEALDASPPLSRPLPVEIADAERQAVRQQRRLQMERELCEKLGLPEVSDQPAAQVRPRSAGLAPPRPPKPKPHRSVAPQAVAVPQSVEEIPRVRRWKSALMPLWLDVSPEKAADSPSELAKTAPAAMSADCGEVTAVTVPEAPEADVADELQGADALQASPSLAVPPEREQQEVIVKVAPLSELPVPAAPIRRPVLEVQQSPSVEMRGGPAALAAGGADSTAACAETRQGAKLLEENTRRLRENLQRLRLENRRHRVRPYDAGGIPHS
ncbi:unnamed protein product, partial [Symbiodinium pilosum]